MYHAVQIKVPNERQTYARIEPRRREQLLSDCFAKLLHILAALETLMLKDDLAHKRVAVRVYPRRRQSEQYIPRLHAGSCNEFGALCHADRESRNIVLANRIKAGHLRRLTAD